MDSSLRAQERRRLVMRVLAAHYPVDRWSVNGWMCGCGVGRTGEGAGTGEPFEEHLAERILAEMDAEITGNIEEANHGQ